MDLLIRHPRATTYRVSHFQARWPMFICVCDQMRDARVFAGGSWGVVARLKKPSIISYEHIA